MDTFPEETSPGRQEEEMIQRGRHGVDPELRDYINGDLTKATTGQTRAPGIGGPHQLTVSGLLQKTNQVPRAHEKASTCYVPRGPEKVSDSRVNPCEQPHQRSVGRWGRGRGRGGGGQGRGGSGKGGGGRNQHTAYIRQQDSRPPPLTGPSLPIIDPSPTVNSPTPRVPLAGSSHSSTSSQTPIDDTTSRVGQLERDRNRPNLGGGVGGERVGRWADTTGLVRTGGEILVIFLSLSSLGIAHVGWRGGCMRRYRRCGKNGGRDREEKAG